MNFIEVDVIGWEGVEEKVLLNFSNIACILHMQDKVHGCDIDPSELCRVLEVRAEAEDDDAPWIVHSSYEEMKNKLFLAQR